MKGRKTMRFRNKQTGEIKDIIINAINASLVSAQQRKRVFFVGELQQDGSYAPVPISQPKDQHIYLKDIIESGATERDKSLCINARVSGATAKHYIEKSHHQMIYELKEGLDFVGGISGKKWLDDGKKLSRNYPQGQRVYTTQGKSTTLSAQGGGWGAKTGLYIVPEATKKGYCVAGPGDSVDLSYPNSKTRRGRLGKGKVNNLMAKNNEIYVVAQRGRENGQQLDPKHDGKSNTLTSVQKDNYLADGYELRKLSPIECERLTTLPDDYTKYGIITTELELYKPCGIMELWKKRKEKNVQWTVATDSHKRTSGIAFFTTKDGKEKALQMKESILHNIKSPVCFAVNPSGTVEQKECALGITRCLGYTATQNTQIKSNQSYTKIKLGTGCMATRTTSTKEYMKNTTNTNASLENVFITSTVTKQITDWLTYISQQNKNTEACIIVSQDLLSEGMLSKMSSLLMETMYCVGNSARYKACGNAFVVKVIEHILKELL